MFRRLILCVLIGALVSSPPKTLFASTPLALPKFLSSHDAFLIADPEGRIILKRNEAKRCTPASTLKILTALTALEKLGGSYRFRTEFYLDRDRNLKVKGYGDPLLISEVWMGIAEALATRLNDFQDLIIDDSYFESEISIPGVENSTNPYDAPNGALCANFNTVYFRRDGEKRVVSAESQTPILPLALERIHSLKIWAGRYSLFRSSWDCAQYAGELLLYFLKERGVRCRGKILRGLVEPQDRLISTYQSVSDLGETLRIMFRSSNNFMANQVMISMGAEVHGPPGTLYKGVKVITDYCHEVLHLEDIAISEGSGISRENMLSAVDMLAVLTQFKKHRRLLVRNGRLLYKTGSLNGVRARAGYIECEGGEPYYFVVLLDGSNPNIRYVMDFIQKLDLRSLQQDTAN